MSTPKAETQTPRLISWLVAKTYRWVLFGALFAIVVLVLSDASLGFTLTIPVAALLFVAIWVSALTGILRARRAFGPPQRRSEAAPSAAHLNPGSCARVWQRLRFSGHPSNEILYTLVSRLTVETAFCWIDAYAKASGVMASSTGPS